MGTRAYERIEEQAMAALREEPIRGLEHEPLGLMGLSHTKLRLGNIIAIARNAKREADAFEWQDGGS